jgi:hypothetical protein
MKYLFYSTCNATPHLETELEIASNLLETGNEVFFLVCKAQLQTCFINPDHDKIICLACRSKGAAGLNLIGIDSSHILDFPEVDIDYNAIKKSFNSIDELKAYKHRGIDVGLAVASSLVSSTRDHVFDTTTYSEQIKRGLETAIFVYESTKKVIDEIKPDCVIIFNGRFLESRPLLRICELMGIKYYTHERGGTVANYVKRENNTPHSLNAIINEIDEVWSLAGDEKEEIGKRFYEDRRNKVIQSWAVFTDNQVDGSLPKNLNSEKKNVAIFNSSMDEYEGIPDFKNKLYKDDNDGIWQLCNSFKHDHDIQFFLRVHPNLKGLNNTQNKELAKLRGQFTNLTIIEADEQVDSYALIDAVDCVVTYGSTIGIEAIYWNKPSILLGRAFYEDLECILTPGTHQEVCELIRSDLGKPNNNIGALKYGYWSLMQGFEFKKFIPDGLFKGRFNNHVVRASIFVRILFHARKFLSRF